MESQLNASADANAARAAHSGDVLVGSDIAQPTKSAAAKPAQDDSFDFIRLLHRSLRGRYRFAILTAFLVGLIGAAEGWRFAGPVYRSDGMVRIASTLPPVLHETTESRPIPNFDSFMQAQQELVTSRPVLEEALKHSIWKSSQAIEERPTLDDLAARMKVETKPRSENMRISFTDSNPAVASAGVIATITAFQHTFERSYKQISEQRMRLLEDYRETLAKQLRDALASTAPPSTPEPAAASSAAPTTRQAVAEISDTLPEAPPAPLNPEQLAMTDGTMRRLLDDRDRAQDEFDQATVVYGSSHRVVARAKLAVEHADQRVEKYLAEYHAYRVEPMLARAKESAAKTVQLKADEPVPAPVAVVLSPAVQQLQNQLDDVVHRIEAAKSESTLQKRFEILSIGEFPVAVQDRRIKTAMACGVAGMGLQVAMVVLAGFLRRRYDFCVEVTDDFASRTGFVAAVPEVEAHNDAQCSADAAECIHHLREALKRHAKTFMITSASPAEGRTNLTMSLALSLCASGSRTLVIDADCRTRGLTRKMKLDDNAGFVQALGGASVADLLKTSRFGLSILPVGQATQADGVAISGAALGSLLERLRDNYDAILIDAGPVLTCVETSVIAALVEGVVMTVARGQRTAAAGEALAKLERVKAKILGTVFNRASFADFYRAIRHPMPVAVAWEPRQVSRLLSDFGPLVRAVALSLRNDVDPLTATDSPEASGIRISKADPMSIAKSQAA